MAEKKPVNRKLIQIGLAIFCVVAIFGFIVLMATNNPAEEREKARAEKKAEEIAKQAPGNEDALRRQIDKELEEQARKEKRAGELEDEQSKIFKEGGADPDLSGTPLPPVDEKFLRDLEEAEQRVAKRPNVDVRNRNTSGQGGGGTGGTSGGAKAYYDEYKDSKGIFGGSDDKSEQAKPAEKQEKAGVYEAIKPQSPPSRRIVAAGSFIRAQLVTGVNTQNSGQVIARVTQNVYDSFTLKKTLIPAGSLLMGDSGKNANIGMERLPVAFTRIRLPDGRTIPIPGMPSADMQGHSGIKGEYYSNIWRAVGPSFVVALIGKLIDKQEDSGNGNVYYGDQSPSISEQVIPKINDRVLDRYGKAEPYFVAAAGESFKIIVTADLELPEPK